MSTHNLCFVQKYEKYQKFLSENFLFFGGKISNIAEQACFHNEVIFFFSAKNCKINFYLSMKTGIVGTH